MSFDISITAGMRADLISLQGTAQLLNRTQQRLSSGKSVNSAVDNPSAYFAAQDHMNHASDLSACKSQMGEAIQAVTAANHGITAITTLIHQAQGLVESAQSADTTTRATLANQFNTVRTQIDQTAADSGYNGKNFLNGDSLSVLFNETGSSSLTVTGFTGNSTGLGITAAAAAGGTSYTNESAFSSGSAISGAVYTFQHLGPVNASNLVVTDTVTSPATTSQLVWPSVGHTLTAQYISTGAMSGITATGTTITVTVGTAFISAGDYTARISGGNLYVDFQSGTDLSATFVSGQPITATFGWKTITNLTAGQYTLAAGNDTTAGTLTFHTAVTGAVTVSYSVDQALWGTDANLTTDTNNLNAAITTLRAQASTMAANLSVITTRQTWSQSMIDNLQTGADNLTLADMNEEGANMLALQTRQQLGIQALSLASQANQSIMRLFG